AVQRCGLRQDSPIYRLRCACAGSEPERYRLWPRCWQSVGARVVPRLYEHHAACLLGRGEGVLHLQGPGDRQLPVSGERHDGVAERQIEISVTHAQARSQAASAGILGKALTISLSLQVPRPALTVNREGVE